LLKGEEVKNMTDEPKVQGEDEEKKKEEGEEEKKEESTDKE